MLHFSHVHKLELCNNSVQDPNQSDQEHVCAACKLPTFGNVIYTCKPCNFNLHLTCTQFPQLFTHPSHPNHTLKLLPTSAYLGGVFNCDACNRRGNGFSYHCGSCEFDLHMLCAAKPLHIRHQFHLCPLELTFVKDPYVNAKGFSCDVCRKIGSKEWLYRCGSCEFDVHLDCTTLPSESSIQVSDIDEVSWDASQNIMNPSLIPSPISVLGTRVNSLEHHRSFADGIRQNRNPNHQQLLQPMLTATDSTLDCILGSGINDGDAVGINDGSSTLDCMYWDPSMTYN